MSKKILFAAVLAAFAQSSVAQVRQSELAGKYHLQAQYELWEGISENDVYAHDDFVFSLEEQSDGTFLLYSFFYNGMDSSWNRLGYGATAEFSPSEQLLYVNQTPWLWDEYMGKFMESYGYGQGDGPMMYFQVQKDPKTGAITFASTENSLGFYHSTFYQGTTQFVYAIDYPGVVKATKLDTYASVKPANLPGEYSMTYKDYDGRSQTTSFTISAVGSKYTMTGIFGSKKTYDVYFEADGKGIYIPIERSENNGHYVSYFGTNVGDCRVSFRFDADGRLIADNYFCYSPDFKNWVDAFEAVATKNGSDGIESVTTETKNQPTYDIWGRIYHEHPSNGAANGRSNIVIRNGKKVLK